MAIVSRDHSGSGWYQAVVARLDLGARTAHALYEPVWQMEGLALSPDGSRVAVVEGYASDHGLLAGSIMVIDLATGVTADPWPDLQTVGLASWCDADSLWYAGTDGTGNACGRVWLDGRQQERWRDDAFIGDAITTPACAITDDAADVWTTHQAHGLAPELAHFDHTAGSWSRRTSFNDPIVEGRVFPDVRTVRWAGEGGVEIEGLLMTPPDAEGPLPMIVCAHGGPTWNWGAYFSDSEPNAVLLASAGYACLLPNPRGSIGRGHAFAQAVIGDGGGVDLRDIMAGVDHCIAEGVADPERLGIAGLSYGGYLAGWAVGQTDRFAAAVAMSVVADYVSFHLTSEVWWYDQAILEGAWNDPASQYLDRSPTTHAQSSTTPTLILQGAEDRCTPGEPGRGAVRRPRGRGLRGRARRVPARRPCAVGARARARRDPANPGLVRSAPAPRAGVLSVLARVRPASLQWHRRRRWDMTDSAKDAWGEVGEKFASWGRRVADRYKDAGSTDAEAAKESERELQRAAKELIDELGRGFTAVGKTLTDDQANKDLGAAVSAIGDAITATVNEASQAIRSGGSADEKKDDDTDDQAQS